MKLLSSIFVWIVDKNVCFLFYLCLWFWITLWIQPESWNRKSRMKSISIRNQSIRWRNTSIVPYMLNVDFFHQTNETIFCFAYWLKVNNFFSNFHFCFGTRQHTRILLIVFLQKIYNLENKNENEQMKKWFCPRLIIIIIHCVCVNIACIFMVFIGRNWKMTTHKQNHLRCALIFFL